MKRFIYRTYETDEATGAEKRTANIAIPLFVIYLLRYAPMFVVRLLLKRAEAGIENTKIEGISIREALCIGYDILADLAAERERGTLRGLLFEFNEHILTHHTVQPLTEQELQMFPPEAREQFIATMHEWRVASFPASRLVLLVE
jgi:hypothetical protein